MAYTSHSFMDNAIALRLLVMLTTPFKEMDAYKAGVIDDKGKYIVKPNDRTAEQKKVLTYLDKLIINVKKMINKLPGGENNLKNIIAAMILIKENMEYENKVVLTEENLAKVYDDSKYDDDKVRFIKTWCEYLKLKEETGTSAIASSSTSNEGSVPNNTTQGIANYEYPLDGQKRRKHLFRRFDN